MKQTFFKTNKLFGDWLPYTLIVLGCLCFLIQIVDCYLFDFDNLKYLLINATIPMFIGIGWVIDYLTFRNSQYRAENSDIKNCCRGLMALALFPLWVICVSYFYDNYTLTGFRLIIIFIIISIWSFMALWSLVKLKKGALFTFRTLMIFWLIVSYCWLHGKDGVIAFLRSSDLLNLFCSVGVVCLVASLLIRGIIISFKSEIIEIYSNAPAKWYTIFFNLLIIFTVIILLINSNVQTWE